MQKEGAVSLVHLNAVRSVGEGKRNGQFWGGFGMRLAGSSLSLSSLHFPLPSLCASTSGPLVPALGWASSVQLERPAYVIPVELLCL